MIELIPYLRRVRGDFLLFCIFYWISPFAFSSKEKKSVIVIINYLVVRLSTRLHMKIITVKRQCDTGRNKARKNSRVGEKRSWLLLQRVVLIKDLNHNASFYLWVNIARNYVVLLL